MKKAPEVEQKILERGRAKLNVEFDTGKSIVKPRYYDEIRKVTDVMKKNPELKVVIEGHTDNVGGEQYNLNLSQKRAEAIKSVMVTKFNIEPSRIAAKGFGYSKPIASNSTKEGREKNRRVEAAVE
jgi:OOP family OmpA-OmpF porin